MQRGHAAREARMRLDIYRCAATLVGLEPLDFSCVSVTPLYFAWPLPYGFDHFCGARWAARVSRGGVLLCPEGGEGGGVIELSGTLTS